MERERKTRKYRVAYSIVKKKFYELTDMVGSFLVHLIRRCDIL